MFRKIHNVFRPNHHGHKGRDGSSRLEQDYHSACTVRLVRSTSMLVVGEQTHSASTLKRSKSTVSIESTLYVYQRQEDRMWLYSQNQQCLEYLEALMDLRRQYTKSMSDFNQDHSRATVSAKKKRAPPPPAKKEAVRSPHLSQKVWQQISEKTLSDFFFFFLNLTTETRSRTISPSRP